MPKKYAYTRTITLPDGRRKYIRGDTLEEVERKKEAVQLQIDNGTFVITSRTSISALAKLWFNTYKKGQLSIRSEETLQDILDRYILPQLGHMEVFDVKPIHIQQLMRSVSQYSKSTQKKVLENTRAIFRMAEENGLISKSPVNSSLKAKGKNPPEKRPLTHEQTDALLAATKGTRAYPLVLVLLYSGIRIGEALGLRWSDIDFDENTITVARSIVYPKKQQAGVINENMKTEAAHRTIPVPPFVTEELKAERARSRSIYVFAMQNGKYLSMDSYRALWRLIDARTIGKGDPNSPLEQTLDFHVHPHLLRHTCVTRWFEAGLDIKEVQHLAGHANPDITLRIYTHYMEVERRRETAEKIRALVDVMMG